MASAYDATPGIAPMGAFSPASIGARLNIRAGHSLGLARDAALPNVRSDPATERLQRAGEEGRQGRASYQVRSPAATSRVAGADWLAQGDPVEGYVAGTWPRAVVVRPRLNPDTASWAPVPPQTPRGAKSRSDP